MFDIISAVIATPTSTTSVALRSVLVSSPPLLLLLHQLSPTGRVLNLHYLLSPFGDKLYVFSNPLHLDPGYKLRIIPQNVTTTRPPLSSIFHIIVAGPPILRSIMDLVVMAPSIASGPIHPFYLHTVTVVFSLVLVQTVSNLRAPLQFKFLGLPLHPPLRITYFTKENTGYGNILIYQKSLTGLHLLCRVIPSYLSAMGVINPHCAPIVARLRGFLKPKTKRIGSPA